MRTADNKSSRQRYWNALGLIVSLVCILFLIRSIEIEELVFVYKTADFSLLMLALATMFAGYLLRSWRWPFFFGINPPSIIDSFRCVMIGFFMNNVLPARIGELVRAHVGGRATKLSRAHVLATVAGERLADGLAISAIFAVFFSLEAGSGKIEEGRELLFVAALFAVAALCTALVLVFRKRIFSLLEQLNEKMPGHLSTYTLIRVRRFIEGLEPMLSPQRLVILTLMSTIIWFVELLVYYQVTIAFNADLSIGALSLFLAAVNFSSLIPAAPGGIGVIEALSTVALVHIGVNPEKALAMVAAQHIIQYLVVGIPGLYFFLRMGGRIPSSEDEGDTALADSTIAAQRRSASISGV